MTLGVELNYWKMLPKDFDPSKKYPVYVAIYGGPGANIVTDSWGGSTFLWQQYLAQRRLHRGVMRSARNPIPRS